MFSRVDQKKETPEFRGFQADMLMYLVLSCILSACAEMHTVFEAISFLAAKAIHSTPESDGGGGLVFFQVSSGAWTKPISPVVPAAAFVNP
jgi:hypothetical protein